MTTRATKTTISVDIGDLRIDGIHMHVSQVAPKVSGIGITLTRFRYCRCSSGAGSVLRTRGFFASRACSRLGNAIASRDLGRVGATIVCRLTGRLLRKGCSGGFHFDACRSYGDPRVITRRLAVNSEDVCSGPAKVCFARKRPILIFIVCGKTDGAPLDLTVTSCERNKGGDIVSLQKNLGIVAPTGSNGNCVRC